MFIPQAYPMDTIQKINNCGTIRYMQAQYEVELFRATDDEKLFSVSDIEVLGVVTSSIRYGVAVDAWQNGLWTEGVVADTSLSDRFFVECSKGIAVRLSTEAWIEWVAPMLDDLTYSDPSSDWVPSDAQLWFSTDFSTTQKIQQSDRTVMSDFPDMFCYPDTKVYNALGFDNNIFHSASRSFKVTWGGDIGAEKPRPQVRIYDLPDEYWVRVWFYLPLDFKLKDWDLILEPFTGAYVSPADRTPYMVRRYFPVYLQGVEGDGSEEVKIRATVMQQTYPDTSGIADSVVLRDSGDLGGLVKRGEWINLSYHVKIGIQGIVEGWIESASVSKTKIMDFRGDITTNYSPRTDIIIAQYYCRIDEPLSTIYFDDFEVWA
jgi:hypothetical protein